jgi:cob(I)alamin adenosyltransferase
MADRPTSIYTRGGDSGTTSLMGSKRVHKDSMRMQALGDVDELNCQMGVIRSLCIDDQMKGFLQEIQNLLFELGAELAQPGTSRLVPPHAARVEQFIDRLDEALPPLKTFILPGGSAAAAQCHLARAVCRRAERSLFRLSRTEHVNSASLQFVNRLSDLLFVVARTINRRSGTAEVPWKSNLKERKRSQ